MRGVSTFGAFTTARLGVYAAQKGLDVTGHNITNINTTGYTRQRVDQMSLRVGSSGRYVSKYDTIIGSGVLCTGVSQLRDPFLDIRFRNEQASVGAMDAKLSGLEELSRVLDEVSKGDGKGIIEAQFNDLVTQLHNLSDKVGQEEFDTLVRSSANSLVRLFNKFDEQLSTIKENTDAGFRQDIETVNTILNNIRDLNDTIMKSEIHGDSALELKDQRNLLIDDLSRYMKVNVEYKSVSIGAGQTVDEMVIRLAGTPLGDKDTSRSVLVDGSFARQLSIRQLAGVDSPNYDLDLSPLTNAKDIKQTGYVMDSAGNYVKPDGSPITYTDAGGNTVNLTKNTPLDAGLKAQLDAEGVKIPGSQVIELGDLDLYGSLQSSREILTEAGEYSLATVIPNDPNATTKRGIPYYQNALDALANKLASTLNEANTGYLMDSKGNYVDGATGAPLIYDDGGGTVIALTKDSMKDPAIDPAVKAAMQTHLETKGMALGGALFSNSSNGDTTSGITAGTISISKSWSIGEVRVLNSKIMGTMSEAGNMKPNSTDNSNIVHMLTLMDGKLSYYPEDVVAGAFEGDSACFNGSFQEFLSNISSTLANDLKSTTTLLENYTASANEISNNRDGVSGVDLNDEATNLMQYQKSYAAACRLMTTLDEALDKLINGTGVVGR